jgi:error-prone DNA polymerase
MGFYSPQSLVADARRHGVQVRGPDIQRSGVFAVLEQHAESTAPTGNSRCVDHEQPPVGPFDRSAHFDTDDHRRDGAFAVRLGLDEVKGIGTAVAEKIVAERDSGEFVSMNDLVRRVGLTTKQLEALAAAGAFEGLGLTRREALWNAGNAAHDREEYLPNSMVTVQPPLFSLATEFDDLLADLWATGISPESHPVVHLREALTSRGVLSAADLTVTESGRRIEIGGVVTHRQRPATASGITFMNIEDETGLINVICSVGVWGRYRKVARDSAALIVRGIIERSEDGVINVLADRFEPLSGLPRTQSRDFH